MRFQYLAPLIVVILLPTISIGSESLIVDFENGKIPEILKKKVPQNRCISVQSEIVRKGKYAVKFELRKGDLFIDEGKPEGYRVELKDPFRAKVGQTYWYSFSLYIPKNFPIHKNRLVLGQWNAEPDNAEEKHIARSPPLSQRFSEGEFSIVVRHNKDKIQKVNGTRIEVFKSKTFELGKWNDFIYQVKWAPTNDGFVRAWLNSKQIVNYDGPVGYNDDVGPYFKFGIYRDDVPETYAVFFDEYQRGDTKEAVGL